MLDDLQAVIEQLQNMIKTHDDCSGIDDHPEPPRCTGQT